MFPRFVPECNGPPAVKITDLRRAATSHHRSTDVFNLAAFGQESVVERCVVCFERVIDRHVLRKGSSVRDMAR